MDFWEISVDQEIMLKETSTIPHINSETNPPPPIINVVCKYLRQFLDTSFGVASLSRGEGPELFLQSGPFQNFHKFFQELTWSQ